MSMYGETDSVNRTFKIRNLFAKVAQFLHELCHGIVEFVVNLVLQTSFHIIELLQQIGSDFLDGNFD
jgi:hypothetical protein